MSLGILISEINHSTFRDHILTFDEDPRWHSFSGKKTLHDKLKTIGRNLGVGLNTNFYRACLCILSKMKHQRVPVGEEPQDLLVLTDMGFDEAKQDSLQIEVIREAFKKTGEEIWGEGKGWKAPRIVIWNLRAEYKDFHARADQEGVVQLSGWSPSILKALQTGNIEVNTPYEGMRYILDDKRYEPVRQIWNNVHDITT